ncbi:hypothetical protein [Nocardioides sp. NPDC006273]|uniref:hypothetical protein n=1 Tax=Actinomycetes TaxID=1760 RepID=UPI0033B4BA81
MCIRVRYQIFDPLEDFQPYDADAGIVTLPLTLARSATLTALRAVLEELAVAQPESGAICWCGEPVMLLPSVPTQRRNGQVAHGA